MGLAFDPEKLERFLSGRPVSDLRQRLEAEGEAVSSQAIYRWLKGSEPKTRHFLLLAEIVGDPASRAAARVLRARFFTENEAERGSPGAGTSS